MVDYCVEHDGDGVRLLLENGDRITIKLVVGNIRSGPNHADGSRGYHVQAQLVVFVEHSEERTPLPMQTGVNCLNPPVE